MLRIVVLLFIFHCVSRDEHDTIKHGNGEEKGHRRDTDAVLYFYYNYYNYIILLSCFMCVCVQAIIKLAYLTHH